MLNAASASLTKTGVVTIDANQRFKVDIAGFEGDGCSCRDLAALAIVWAIGELQRELMQVLQLPGGGSVAVD